MNKLFFFFLVLLCIASLLLSILLRSTEVLNGNYLFGFDQGRDYLAVKNIVVSLKPTLIGSEWGAGSAGFQGLFHGPFHYYFLSIPFFIFSGNPYGGIVYMFVLGIIAIVLGFYLGYKMFGVKGGLVLATLISVCPPIITQSRFVWNSHPATPFIILMFISVYLYIISSKNKFLFLSSLISAFIYNFQTGISIPLSVSLFIFLVYLAKGYNFKKYLYLILGSILGYLPFLLFEVRHGFVGIKSLFIYVIRGGGNGIISAKFLTNGYDHFNTFIYNFYDSFPFQQDIPHLFFPLFIVLFMYLLWNEKNKEIKKFMVFLVIIPITSFVIFLFLRNSVYIYYLISLNLIYTTIFAYMFFSSKKHNLIHFFLFVFLCTMLFVSVPKNLKTFSYDYYDHGGTAKIKGKLEAIDYIYKDAKGEKFALLAFTPPVYTYDIDYLLWWYGERKYSFVPKNEKKGKFYLLIEPDPSKPWSYQGWLDTVIIDGEIISTVNLPNGYIIQKRVKNI